MVFPSKYLWLGLAGVSGGVVGINLHPDIKTWGQRVMFVFGGLACTMFLSEPIARHFGLQDLGEISAVGFGIAIVWQTIIARFSNIVNNIKLPLQNQTEQATSTVVKETSNAPSAE
ncbi:hypothetical protein [Herbiconiux daphne]|uniref:Holin n=1 Tax=Herbiconiux daphne TaxID=2970914 RepID=A0ABT2HB68_9MICO|nr:hypothetical protein [Herbiconiux daphne]MCS5737218.1 hypothetical protein [Herbiconiux daphne]